MMLGLDLSRLVAALLFATVLFPAYGQEAKPDIPAHGQESKADAPAKAKAAGGGDASASLPADGVTQHTISLGGQQLAYRATAGALPLFGPKGEVAAKVFYVSYTLENATGRPVTFAFNGGPGAAAAFLHLGALGPRIVPFKENGSEPVLPARLADNPDCWLAFTDLVFVDPVGTGYSRATAGGEDAERAYWGVEKDAASIADFVRLYLTRNGRELAPLFLAGESYGGFRAATLADRLLGMGLRLKGAVMISPALEFSMLHGDDYTILPMAFALPSLTAANLEMREGSKGPLDAVHEAEAYARTQYLLHLAEGLKRDDAVIAALAKFTGLDSSIIARNHGRVPASLFFREYQRRKDRTLSRYDATVSTPLPQPSDNQHFDPILDGAVSVLTPATINYLRQELGFRTDLEYRLLNREASGHWDYGTKPSRQGYAGSLDELQNARVRNPALKILIAHGYTDLVTPYSMSRYLIDHLRPIETAAPIELRVYRGGHMMYLRPASRAELAVDARGLYAAAEAK
jgi:carboxypeptidase C (cathepsin A)